MVCLVSSFIASSLTIYFYYLYAKDAELVRTLAGQLTENIVSSAEKVRVLNAFVYQNRGFAKNRSYYLVERLGATPVQVLEEGGDCADKSRLLAAMLDQIGIRASLAMLYPCQECAPVHTVVIARTESGIIVADPVYDLMFPKREGGYYDVREMMGDRGIQRDRVAFLVSLRDAKDNIASYDSAYHYDFVTTVNWFKYPWLKRVSRVLPLLGLDPRLVNRPRVFEDPKLFFIHLGVITAGMLAMLTCISRRFAA
jgi:hypothetical protein